LVEFWRQWLRARDDPGNILIVAGPRGSSCPALFGFEPPNVLLLPSLLSGLFFGPFLDAWPRVFAHDFPFQTLTSRVPT